MTTRNQKRKTTALVSDEVIGSSSNGIPRVESVEINDQVIRVASTSESLTEKSSALQLEKFKVYMNREISNRNQNLVRSVSEELRSDFESRWQGKSNEHSGIA